MLRSAFILMLVSCYKEIIEVSRRNAKNNVNAGRTILHGYVANQLVFMRK